MPKKGFGPVGTISIHALLAESDLGILGRRLWYRISIHALLAESDLVLISTGLIFTGFLSTLSLRRATATVGLNLVGQIFLSTLSLRRATSACWRGCLSRCNFYPRSPCGERHLHTTALSLPPLISIHALLAESDLVSMLNRPHSQISIHALLAESDPD